MEQTWAKVETNNQRKCLFVATVSTDSTVFVATLPVSPVIFGDVDLAY